MRYCLKLYPDQISKEGLKSVEIEADDAECVEYGETVFLNFISGKGKEATTIYGVDFSKVVEFYAIDAVISIEETGKNVRTQAPKFTLLEFKKEQK
jgi:hypothetical protein